MNVMPRRNVTTGHANLCAGNAQTSDKRGAMCYTPHPGAGETGGTGSAAPQGRRVCIETSVCALALVTSRVVNVHGLSLESGPSDVPLWWIFNEEHGQGER